MSHSSELIAALRARGFSSNFVLDGNCLLCTTYRILVQPNEFQVLEMHFIPGEPEQVSECMLYAITIKTLPIKGILQITGLDNIVNYFELMSGGRRRTLIPPCFRQQLLEYGSY